MKSKYGDFESEQIKQYIQALHNNILSLLYLKENHSPTLDEYFVALLWKLNGYNELFGNPIVMIDIVSNLEEARLESHKDNCDYTKYRKLVLDSFNLLDKLEV